MDCSPPGSSVKNTGVGCHFLLRVTLPTQRSNLHLLHSGGFFTTEPSGKPLHPLLLLRCLYCYFETFPCTMILKSYDKDLWGPHWGLETLLLFLTCEWNADTYNSMITGENHCFWFKLLHVWRLIPIVLCQPVPTLETSLTFDPLKKKSSLCFCFGVSFSLLPPSPLFSLPISGHACLSSGLFQSTFLQSPLSTQKLTTWKLFQVQWFGSSAEFDN